MTDAISFDASPDVLYHGVPLRHVMELPVLGIPVRFELNSAAALAVVEAAFGIWRGLRTNPGLIAPEGVRVRLIVHDGDERDGSRVASHAPVTCRMPDADRVIVHTPGSVGIADTRRQEATAYITPALLADRAHVQYSMIEGLTLTLVTACDRYPVHAAAIARGGVALLLAGPPGTGKSTLAYQAHRLGLRVLSDDAVYVQLNPEVPSVGPARPGAVAHDGRNPLSGAGGAIAYFARERGREIGGPVPRRVARADGPGSCRDPSGGLPARAERGGHHGFESAGLRGGGAGIAQERIRLEPRAVRRLPGRSAAVAGRRGRMAGIALGKSGGRDAYVRRHARRARVQELSESATTRLPAPLGSARDPNPASKSGFDRA